MARMPEPQKATRQGPRTAAVMGALTQRPAVRGVTVAEGAPDHWSDLRETLPGGREVLDLDHAAEPLGAALGAAAGAGTPPYQERLETLSTGLRDAPHGVHKVSGALRRWRTRSPRRQAMHTARAYVREPHHRMDSAALRAQHLPMGSGVVEVSRLQCPYTDSRFLSYYWPDRRSKPCRTCRQAPIEDRRRERPCMPAPVLPPRL